MFLMAIDHASAFIGRTHYFEIWGVELSPYDSAGWFLTRFVSHFCAPGFFMLMGMSMIFLTENRLSKNWSLGEVRKYFWKRGGLIILLMIFVEFPGWGLGMISASPSVGGANEVPGTLIMGIPTTVLFGLAVSMLVGSWMLRWKEWQLIMVTVSCFLLSGWYIEQLDIEGSFSILEQILLVPGKGYLMVIYPLIPWLGVTTFGMLIARRMLAFKTPIYQRLLVLGLLFLGVFVGIRATGFGNFQIDNYHDWISFLTLIKYPPSVSFFLMTTGVLCILLWCFSKIELTKYTEPIHLFGQTAMFFYLAHLYVYAIIGFFFPNGSGLPLLYLCWAIGLIPLYFLCRWYLKFKKGKAKDSIWKMI